jgi:hypothetical protein
VIQVLADGLRPDAVTPSRMPSLDGLADAYTLALHATTVRPSATVAALATVATDLAPASHGLIDPGLRFLPRLTGLRPLAAELTRSGIPTRVVTGELGPLERSVVSTLVTAAGSDHGGGESAAPAITSRMGRTTASRSCSRAPG